MADESIIREAVGRDIDVEITAADVAELRGLMGQFDELIASIIFWAAKPVNGLSPAEIEQRKLIADRDRRYGGNGKRRFFERIL
jgi:hypothetical protein